MALPHYQDNVFLQRAVTRYRALLCLMQENPQQFLCPLYDIDLVWHCHQVPPSPILCPSRCSLCCSKLAVQL